MKRVCLVILAALSIMTMCTSVVMAAETAIEEDEEENDYARIIRLASDEEIDELCRVMYLECRGESFEGKCAVAETILNRVLSESFPDSIHGVLSERGQFSTWKRISTAYDVSEDDISVQQGEICRAIMYVYDNGRTVLPSSKYVYFDTRGINGREHLKVGNQYFGREK